MMSEWGWTKFKVEKHPLEWCDKTKTIAKKSKTPYSVIGYCEVCAEELSVHRTLTEATKAMEGLQNENQL